MTRFYRRAAAIPLLAALLAGCSNPFLPAQAPAPGGDGTTSILIDYATADGVLSTIESAIGARGAGVAETAYLNAFADSLTNGIGCTFTLDPDVVAERKTAGQAVPEPWRVDLEPAFYRYLCALDPSGEYEMTFSKLADDEESGPDVVLKHVGYVLTGASVGLAQGAADIELRKVSTPSTRWVITRWADHLYPGIPPTSDPTEFCFSRLRIDSYNQT